MRRQTFALLASAAISLAAAPAFAADAGTYRPGATYNSVSAGSPNICDSQCAGDAQCRSWNYIKVNDGAPGVCEFNSTLASPVPSAISISGENSSSRSFASVVKGGTNTTRVGAPSVTQASAAAKVSSQPRRVVRKAPPQQVQTRAAKYVPPHNSQHLSLMEQQRLQGRTAQLQAPHTQTPRTQIQSRPRFRHSLEEGGSPRAPQNIQQQRRPQPQQQAYAPPQMSKADPRLMQRLQQKQQSGQNPVQSQPMPIAPKGPAYSEAGLSAPPGVPPLSANAQYAPTPPSAAGLAGQAPRPMPQQQQRRVNIASELSPRAMGSDSLFGSLYDDVKVPRPIDPSIAADPDAPIPTVSSVPTKQIYSAPLPPVN